MNQMVVDRSADLDIEAELNKLAMSDAAKPLLEAVKKHIAENVAPIAEEFHRLGEGRADRWSWAPGQLELLQTAKDKAKAAGLWNFFLPDSEIGQGLTNLDYAYIAVELGKQPRASSLASGQGGPRLWGEQGYTSPISGIDELVLSAAS